MPDQKRRRLHELGFLTGASVKCIYTAPSGSPLAFRVKGALIALRASDCLHILVTPNE